MTWTTRNHVNTAFRLAILGLVLALLSMALFPMTFAYTLSASMLLSASFGIFMVNRGYVKEHVAHR